MKFDFTHLKKWMAYAMIVGGLALIGAVRDLLIYLHRHVK